MGSRALPLTLTVAALIAAASGLDQPALYLGLLTVPAAAAAAFVAISDVLDRQPALLRAVTNGLALTLVVAASAVRENAAHGATPPPLATYAVAAALLAYLAPAVAWVLEPLHPAREGRQRRPQRVVEELRADEGAASAALHADGLPWAAGGHGGRAVAAGTRRYS